jgi:uncharacterized protein HemX
MYILVALLATLVVLHFLTRRKESYENYDETSCLQLATKNQDNLKSLKKDVDTLLELQSKVQALQNSTDANSKQLSSLVDQVYKTPAV